jgi:MFS family permease
MSTRSGNRWLVVACVCALAALALMTWQIFDPTVWPVLIAMSLGQVLGTASFAVFGYVVLADFRAHLRARKDARSIEPEG